METLPARLAATLCCLAVVLAGSPGEACTAFLLKHPSGPLMAKSFDWDIGAGQLVVNQRGLAKSALVDEGAKPVRWTSRYGSVSFNQHGRELPLGGMNETGLAIEVLWLDGTVYPEPGERRSIGALQWVQYCLDSFRTVGEVVASASEVAISSTAPLHFLACDPTGSCAVVEFIDGAVVARWDRTLPLAVLTNDTYRDSLDFLNRTLGYGGEPVKPEGTGSLARFARAANGAYAARSKASERPVDDAFAVLADVAQPERTRWSIVYELQEKRVSFRTATNPRTRTLAMASLDLDCTAAPLVLDLGGTGEGDAAASLVPYSAAANRRLVETGLAAPKLTPVTPELVERIAAYPETLLCTFAAPGE
ncbi:MAG: linear amide C-N hydrolase [Thermoanaerobaculales bacterium]|jgi:choloylglycine hydrolase|nr:linear amide C-N hydrolase [Thermoanaerobaculales bacterium]